MKSNAHQIPAHHRLKARGLSSTPSRIAILELLDEGHRLYSIDQIITELKKKKAKGSLVFTTIYRCLLKLAEADLVKEVDLGDGTSRFESSHDDHHHHHVICNKCGTIAPIEVNDEVCGLEKFEKAIKKLGYQSLNHRLEFFGLCRQCQ